MAVGWSYDAAAEIHSAENTDQLINWSSENNVDQDDF